MNAKELFVQGDDGFKSAGVWYCGKCRTVYRSEAEAERCGRPKLCGVCGKEIEKDRSYYTLCGSCAKKNEDAKEKARFDKARKLSLAEYTDDVITLGNGDDYMTLEELAEGDNNRPSYVYGVKRDAIKIHELSDEDLCHFNLSEDFSMSDIPGFDELLEGINKMIRDWNAIPNGTYIEDDSTVILIPPNFYDEAEENEVEPAAPTAKGE